MLKSRVASNFHDVGVWDEYWGWSVIDGVPVLCGLGATRLEAGLFHQLKKLGIFLRPMLSAITARRVSQVDVQGIKVAKGDVIQILVWVAGHACYQFCNLDPDIDFWCWVVTVASIAGILYRACTYYGCQYEIGVFLWKGCTYEAVGTGMEDSVMELFVAPVLEGGVEVGGGRGPL